jgi:CO/xanthine dehydrogenase FAD-binding subunit
MESRRTRVTVPGAGDTRVRFFRRAQPVALVGVAVAAVATVGDGGVGRAHYLRQLVFGPAGPGASRAQPAARAGAGAAGVPAIPTGAAREADRVARSAVHGHRPRPRRSGLVGPR